MFKVVNAMTICPIALVVGCKKCPAFAFCPLTNLLGDQQLEEADLDEEHDHGNNLKF